MPRVKRVNTLFAMSIDFIAESMDKFCKKMSTVNKVDGYLERSTNVFNSFPSYFIEEIIKVLGEKGFLKKEFLKYLITPQLHTLDFSSMCVRCEISDLLLLAARRCPDLKSLILFHPLYYFLDNEDYMNFIPNFGALQVLDISYSKAGDMCLGILGSHCKELRELYAGHSSVTDSGLKELFIIGQCKLINTLDLDWTKVTNAGIKMALDNLPLLRVLHHQSTVECLSEIHQECQELGIIRKFNLSILTICSSFQSGSLCLAASLCPLLTNVDIRMAKQFTDVDLLSLLVLKNICELKIEGCRNGPITFLGGVKPLLNSIGNSLKSLELSSLRDLSIPVVTKCCPNLISLNLTNNFYYANCTNFVEIDEVLCKLQTLNLRGRLPSLHLFLLLFSPSLVHVRLCDCVTLTDEILVIISTIHPFHCLEHFEMSNCNFVTDKGIDVFMKDNNALKNLEFKWCDKVTRKNICDWKKKAEEKNWQLSISAQLSF